MKVKPIQKILFFSSLALFILSCGNKPLFTDLAENSLVVKLKGTYESTNPAPWDLTVLGDSTQAEAASVIQHPNISESFPSVFKLDLAEMRLVDGAGNNEAKFSIYREVFDDLTISNPDTSDFFNGNGITLHNDDVRSGIDYRYVKLYIRKMVFNGAQQYVWNGTGWNAVSGYPIATFHESDYNNQFDFNQYLTNSRYYAIRKEATYTNEVFPVTIPISGGMMFNKEDKQTVLEIRLVIKNFVKKYETEVYDSNNNRNLIHYYAVSDWLQSVNPFENTLGGNLLGVATSYVPGKTGTYNASKNATAGYVILIPGGDNISNYSISQNDLRSLYTGGPGQTNCDLTVIPTFPTNSSSDMDGVLNYYLKTEEYKIKWTQCGGFTNYTTAWDTFHTASTLKLPPYVIYLAGGGNGPINNIKPGSYDVYQTTLGYTYTFGVLPIASEFTSVINITIP